MKIVELDTKIVGNGKDILYVNGKYFLLSEEPAKVCYSENLKEWTEIQLETNYVKPNSIAYGNGIYIITGASGKTNDTYYYYSTDGINWTPKKFNTGENFSIHCNSCKFINNRFIALLGIYWKRNNQPYRTENWFYESKNGVDWTKHTLIIDSNEMLSQMDIDYGNGVYVRVGESGSIYTSQNLNNWAKRTSNTKNKLVGVTWGKGQFVIVGDNGTILTSPNGINWAFQDSTTQSYLIRSRYASGVYIAVGYNGVILQSIDGINWKNISNKDSGLRYGLTYNNDRFVISATSYTGTGTIPIFYFDVTRNITVSEDDSSLFFFDKNLNMLGIIDYFISLRWRRKYFEAGEFEIVVPVTPYFLRMLNTDVLVMRNNYTEAGIIETIEFTDDSENEEVKISGRFLSCLFDRRIVKNKINFNGQTIEGMNTIVDEITPLCTNWETTRPSMSSRNIQFQCTYKNVYDYLCKLSSYSNIGFRIVPNVDSKVYMFETYVGVDRSSTQNDNEQYSFSDDNYNIEKGSLVISNKTKVNYVLVGGQGEDDNRTLVEVQTGETGFDLHEIFLDQKSSSSQDLTDSEYKQQLIDAGEAKVSDETFSFEATATSMEDYKKKWNLGDIVNLKKEKWGIQTSYRIVEVEEVIEDGTKTIYPTFGSPLATDWSDE